MLTLTPEKLPVTVYRSTDPNAPILDRSPNCVATILKACLVTGFGQKAGAGWTLAFEDNDDGVKVLRPKVGADTDFFMKLSNDTGQEMTVQVLMDMTDIDGGELKLQCDTPFKYAKGRTTGKWVLVACGRTFWFYNEQRYDGDENKRGSWLVCGDTGKDTQGERAVLLHHSGGIWDDGSYYSPIDTFSGANGRQATQIFTAQQQGEAKYLCLFNGKDTYTDALVIAPVFVNFAERIFAVPGICASAQGGVLPNFKTINSIQSFIALGMSAYGYDSNFMIATDYWVY